MFAKQCSKRGGFTFLSCSAEIFQYRDLNNKGQLGGKPHLLTMYNSTGMQKAQAAIVQYHEATHMFLLALIKSQSHCEILSNQNGMPQVIDLKRDKNN